VPVRSDLEVFNASGELERALLVCDHASAAIPPELGGLGLTGADLRRHIALDIGAAELTRALAVDLDVPAVLAPWSRLVVDCNRAPDDSSAIVPCSDGTQVPGNAGLDPSARRARIDRYHRPYHETIDALLDRIRPSDVAPALIAIHSFTPRLNGSDRPWQIGILWDRDARLAAPLLAALRAEPLVVGDNEPYSGRHPTNYTVDRHGAARGIPHVGIEVRQDLIDAPDGVDRWRQRLAGVLRRVLAPTRRSAG
jgi:predicted N-formylglutamate amidohydrolase